MGAFALGFACGVIESYLILWFFGIPVSLKLALLLRCLASCLTTLRFLFLSGSGTQEAGKALVFAMLGLSPTQGLAAGVIYRIRELTWAFIGLQVLAHSQLKLRLASAQLSLRSSAPPNPKRTGDGQDTEVSLSLPADRKRLLRQEDPFAAFRDSGFQADPLPIS